MNKIPITLFLYRSLNLHTIRNLVSHSVYFSSAKDFNDPYDCAISVGYIPPTEQELAALYPNSPDEMESAKIYLPILQMLNIEIAEAVGMQDRGICCLSAKNDNLLMWSHYADQHRGICLEFRTNVSPFDDPRQVQYKTAFPVLTHTETSDTPVVNDALCCTKSKDWAYEEEWRVFQDDARKNVKCKPRSLKSVRFGTRMQESDKQFLQTLLRPLYPDLELYSGKISETSFKVEFEPYVTPS